MESTFLLVGCLRGQAQSFQVCEAAAGLGVRWLRKAAQCWFRKFSTGSSHYVSLYSPVFTDSNYFCYRLCLSLFAFLCLIPLHPCYVRGTGHRRYRSFEYRPLTLCSGEIVLKSLYLAPFEQLQSVSVHSSHNGF